QPLQAASEGTVRSAMFQRLEKYPLATVPYTPLTTAAGRGLPRLETIITRALSGIMGEPSAPERKLVWMYGKPVGAELEPICRFGSMRKTLELVDCCDCCRTL